MKDKTLYLFFPQWQGSGETNEIFHGANLLREIINHDFINVPLSSIQGYSCENNIFAYKQIIDQLITCKKLIKEYSPEKIFSLGGDCGIELAPVSYLNKIHENLGIIWFDAHGDLNTPESSPSKHFHGMPLMTLLGKGEKNIVNLLNSKLSINQLFLIGTRELDSAEEKYILGNKVTLFTVNIIEENENLLIETLKSKGFTNIYIHLDLDVIEPVELPYVKCPTPNGLSLRKLTNILNRLNNSFHIIGGSLCEFAPNNTNNITQIKNVVKSLFESYSTNQSMIYKK